MPNAQIVADIFHVMKQINQELDQERKKENFRLKESLKPKKLNKLIPISKMIATITNLI